MLQALPEKIKQFQRFRNAPGNSLRQECDKAGVKMIDRLVHRRFISCRKPLQHDDCRALLDIP
jgi:hypothetical protein